VDLFEEEEVYYLSVKEDGVQLNPAALRFLEEAYHPESDDDQFTNIYDQLAARCPDPFLDFDALFHFEKAFLERYPKQNFAAFQSLAELNDLKGLNQTYRQPFLRSVRSKQSKYGTFTIQSCEPKYGPARDTKICPKHKLSQVIGPPGTGKSFTIDALCRGQSVLVVSKYDQAVDVISQKIEKDLGFSQVVARSGKGRSQKKQLRNKIQGALHKIGYQSVNKFTVQDLQFKIRSVQKKIDRLEEMLVEREKNELADSEFLIITGAA